MCGAEKGGRFLGRLWSADDARAVEDADGNDDDDDDDGDEDERIVLPVAAWLVAESELIWLQVRANYIGARSCWCVAAAAPATRSLLLSPLAAASRLSLRRRCRNGAAVGLDAVRAHASGAAGSESSPLAGSGLLRLAQAGFGWLSSARRCRPSGAAELLARSRLPLGRIRRAR